MVSFSVDSLASEGIIGGVRGRVWQISDTKRQRMTLDILGWNPDQRVNGEVLRHTGRECTLAGAERLLKNISRALRGKVRRMKVPTYNSRNERIGTEPVPGYEPIEFDDPVGFLTAIGWDQKAPKALGKVHVHSWALHV